MKKLTTFAAIMALLFAFATGCKKEGTANDESKSDPAGMTVNKDRESGPDLPKHKSAQKPDVAEDAAKTAEENSAKAQTLDPKQLEEKGELPKTPELPIDESKLDDVVGHMGELMTILENNADDPAKAGAALEKYLATNKKALAGTIQELKTVSESLTPEQQEVLGMKLLKRLAPLTKRQLAIVKAHPELFSDQKVKEAMKQIMDPGSQVE